MHFNTPVLTDAIFKFETQVRGLPVFITTKKAWGRNMGFTCQTKTQQTWELYPSRNEWSCNGFVCLCGSVLLVDCSTFSVSTRRELLISGVVETTCLQMSKSQAAMSSPSPQVSANPRSFPWESTEASWPIVSSVRFFHLQISCNERCSVCVWNFTLPDQINWLLLCWEVLKHNIAQSAHDLHMVDILTCLSWFLLVLVVPNWKPSRRGIGEWPCYWWFGFTVVQKAGEGLRPGFEIVRREKDWMWKRLAVFDLCMWLTAGEVVPPPHSAPHLCAILRVMCAHRHAWCTFNEKILSLGGDVHFDCPWQWWDSARSHQHSMGPVQKPQPSLQVHVHLFPSRSIFRYWLLIDAHSSAHVTGFLDHPLVVFYVFHWWSLSPLCIVFDCQQKTLGSVLIGCDERGGKSIKQPLTWSLGLTPFGVNMWPNLWCKHMVWTL